MKVYLIVAKGKRQGFPIPITVDLFMIGSEKICQLRSPLPGVAARHCALRLADNKVFLRDLGSDEGTIVNGAPMQPGEELPLHKGDRITVGPLEFVMQYSETVFKRVDTEEWAFNCLQQADGEQRELVEDLNLMARRDDYTNASVAAQSIIDQLTAQRGVTKGRLRISKEGEDRTITVVRLLDTFLVAEAEIALLRKELHAALTLPFMRVLLDFKTVKRVSAAAASMFSDLAGSLQTRNSRMAICRLEPDLHAMLRSMPMMADIVFYRTKEAALDAEW